MALDERYLDLVEEECAEIIQRCTKIKRFGLRNVHEGTDNLHKLQYEIGDLLSVLEHLGLDINSPEVKAHKIAKDEKLKTYGPDGTYEGTFDELNRDHEASLLSARVATANNES